MSVRVVLHPKRLRQTSQFCWSLILLIEWPVLIDRVEAPLTTFSEAKVIFWGGLTTIMRSRLTLCVNINLNERLSLRAREDSIR
jgi:hypothetical protein